MVGGVSFDMSRLHKSEVDHVYLLHIEASQIGSTPARSCSGRWAGTQLPASSRPPPTLLISLHPQSGVDPLGDYLSSLQRVAAFDAEEVLPAHEYRFDDRAARVDELIGHHEQRFAEALEAISKGMNTAWQIASGLTWSRPWDETDGFMRRAAAFETLAHLLSVRGILRELPGEPYRWELDDVADGSDFRKLAAHAVSRVGPPPRYQR